MATTQLAKWGNSLAVRISKAVADTARLREGDPVEVGVNRKGVLIVRPTRRKYRLKALVSKITSKNRHEEIDWGKPVGREVW